MEIVELDAIRALLDAGIIVIAGGGGGIPAMRLDNGDLVGVEGVIDKDMTSALLAARLGIDTLLILTGVEKVCVGFRTPEERTLDRISVQEAEQYMAAGEFPAGSMGPKIRAAIWFLRNGGHRSIITEVGKGAAALAGKTGTEIVAE
jgi:carbamate kinase